MAFTLCNFVRSDQQIRRRNKHETNTASEATRSRQSRIQLYRSTLPLASQARQEHRVGDGPSEQIPMGIEMKVDTAIASRAVLGRSEDQQPETAYLAKREFEHYVEVGCAGSDGAKSDYLATATKALPVTGRGFLSRSQDGYGPP